MPVAGKLMADRTIISNIPTVDTAPESLVPVILRLNPHIYTPPLANPSPDEAEEHIIRIDQAIDLCGRMLRLDATKRITAANALRHPFLEVGKGQEGYEDMMEDEVLDVREGKCGHLHGIEGNKRESDEAGGRIFAHGRSRVLWGCSYGHAIWPRGALVSNSM